MFDFSFSELMLIGAVALVVLGPERLPKVARMAGSLVGKAQRLIAGVKQELSAQVDMETLKSAKNEFESAADSMRQELHRLGETAEQEIHAVAEGVDLRPAWERLPQQRTPADFGKDQYGNRLPLDDADSIYGNEDDYDAFGDGSLSTSMQRHTANTAFQTASLHQQAMRRRRDMRPRYRVRPRLRLRKQSGNE